MLLLEWRLFARFSLFVSAVGLLGSVAACVLQPPPTNSPVSLIPPTAPPVSTATATTVEPPLKLIPFEATTQEINFTAPDGTPLAGQIDWPPGQSRPPLIVIIHHSGPVDRDAYQYLAARLVPAGYAVFRFDKRGNGRSAGVYGCCEAEDALAAYQAAIKAVGYDSDRVYIIAQSLGSQILAEKFPEFEQSHRLKGVILLSSLLEGEAILPIQTPIHIIVSDSEPDLAAVGEAATQAHEARYHAGATFTVVPQTEHTLFDISEGPIDWNDPNWPDKFHPQAWQSLSDWLETH